MGIDARRARLGSVLLGCALRRKLQRIARLLRVLTSDDTAGESRRQRWRSKNERGQRALRATAMPRTPARGCRGRHGRRAHARSRVARHDVRTSSRARPRRRHGLLRAAARSVTSRSTPVTWSTRPVDPSDRMEHRRTTGSMPSHLKRQTLVRQPQSSIDVRSSALEAGHRRLECADASPNSLDVLWSHLSGSACSS